MSSFSPFLTLSTVGVVLAVLGTGVLAVNGCYAIYAVRHVHYGRFGWRKALIGVFVVVDFFKRGEGGDDLVLVVEGEGRLEKGDRLMPGLLAIMFGC
ncbi:uncharacterized protein RAG0_10642 [Rhynchosporium agropyri]|uniref:Uncharacterized protein n=1 Tax=Rhynchosporium agropyri TaxID=914238 RepID=A0A1E1L0N8_9HELO|nr:uncharacterized protein RAG0_10642 [Rhynchosporium agropyri]